jgi:dipeptidyl aminopeptidase/acylaminoacyl peptidase
MKSVFFVLVSFFFFEYAISQTLKVGKEKPPIDFSTFGNWPYIANASITNDGEFVSYGINDPARKSYNVILKATKGDWQFAKSGVDCRFSDDSKKAFFKNSGDSLCLIELGRSNIEYIPDVISFKIANENNYLAYLSKYESKLMVRNLENKLSIVIDSVKDYYFTNDGKLLLINITRNNNGFASQSLVKVDLSDNKRTIIWNSRNSFSNIISFAFSNNGHNLAFLVGEKMGQKSEKMIWYYDSKNDTSAILIDNNSLNEMGLEVNGIEYNGLTNDGKSLFVSLIKKMLHEPKADMVKVDVWSYTDRKLQSQQLNEIEPRIFSAVVCLEDHAIYRIEKEDEITITKNESFAVVVSCKGAENEWHWNKASLATINLVSLKNGSRTVINQNVKGSMNNILSSYFLMPGGKYVIYFNPERGNYFSYEIGTGIKRNITSYINAKWTTYVKRDLPMAPYMPIGFAGAIKTGEAVLLYDQCDIYQVDPLMKNPAINLTNNYGRIHNIEFRLALDEKKYFDRHEVVVLRHLNTNKKHDGFYRIQIGRTKAPDSLTSQPYIFKGTWEDDRFHPESPIKAKNIDIYLVRRMSAKESPNYYWTTDFSTYHKITSIHPEKEYNWIKTDLVTWTTVDGHESQGIIYKPENFNPERKYPLIFYYYENSSEGLNGFIRPELTSGALNIPYYVSNGYLVFLPDMHYKIGYKGQSVMNIILSAVKFLSKCPYIDSKRMGLQGHSRGGWQTNYIITHTNIFAAAMSSSGFCDYISLYNGLHTSEFGGTSRQSSYEIGYQRIGSTLWQKPNLFIENSPVLNANRIITPLLIMANNNDKDIPFEQGIEFFTALRRLGKRAWMLQYDEGGHLVTGKASEDLETRMKQFFDHYLMGNYPPIWMTTGIPASLKGDELGYALDFFGTCGTNCIICKKNNLNSKKN